jgi:hypothetical protein
LIAGHSADVAIKRYSEGGPQRERLRIRKRKISEIEASISIIEKKIIFAKNNGANEDIIINFESIRDAALIQLASIMEQSITLIEENTETAVTI